jgi:hypothetical protein
MRAPSPYEGLPQLSDLLSSFNEVLNQEMQEYTKHQDTNHFQKLLDKLGTDLGEFIKSIDIWHDLSTTPEQVRKLQKIEIQVDEAQHLINRAIGLIKPTKSF